MNVITLRGGRNIPFPNSLVILKSNS